MSMNVESEEESGLNGVHNTRNKKRSREITSKKIVPEKGKKTFKQKYLIKMLVMALSRRLNNSNMWQCHQ